ncbi:orotidine-5'-phosphate decarboxylase [Candidatus Endowatersipora endosymbiont of Watersipora subatra]|uniref:orotidine-5'-phosphate decarboxylase n=1 Tax=Candidatus Endowatersipora endosymbiont of Watersipora subatra TaxID=3077946 RepID=UPI00312C77D3
MGLDDRLIVGLDVPTLKQAREIIDELGNLVSFYKIGQQLCCTSPRDANAFRNGFHLAQDLISENKKVFLDLKLLDVPNTVANAVERIAETRVHMLTIHAYPKAMEAAVKAAQGHPLTLLGVTVLTSLDDLDLIEAGYAYNVSQLVRRRAIQARDIGMNGIVSSACEALNVREIVGPDMAVVTPAIRPAGVDYGDQKRVMTPKDALQAGASHIVVGRPIILAYDRRAAVKSIISEMQ